jgi:autotransporter translocation and assembly factor TamB
LTALLCWGGEIEGSLAATGDITGSWRRPRLDLRLDGNAIRVERFPLDRVDGRVLWDAQGVRLDRVRVVGTQRAFHTDQAPFGLKGLSGGVTYQLLVEGPLSNPTARLEAELKRPGWGPLKFDRGALQVVLENHVARLDFFKGQRDFTVLQLKARHDLRKGVGALDLVTLESKSEAQRGKDFAVALPEKAAQDGDHFLADWAKKAGGGFQAEAHCEDFDLSRLGDLSPTSRRVAGKLTAALSLKRAGRKQPLKVTGKGFPCGRGFTKRVTTRPGQGPPRLRGLAKGQSFHPRGRSGFPSGTLPSSSRASAALPQTESPWDLRSKRRVARRSSSRAAWDPGDGTSPRPWTPPRRHRRALSSPSSGLARLPSRGRVAVRGQTSSPTFHGPFTTDAFSTFLPVLNARLSDAQLETTLSGSRVTLAPSPLRFNGGPVTLRGTTSWNAPGLGDFDFKGSCAKVKVDLPRLLKRHLGERPLLLGPPTETASCSRATSTSRKGVG